MNIMTILSIILVLSIILALCGIKNEISKINYQKESDEEYKERKSYNDMMSIGVAVLISLITISLGLLYLL